jgi:proton-coupled amino acid transporter
MTDTPSSSQPDSREAEIVSRHLPPGYSAGHDVVADDHGAAAGSAADSEGPGQESSLKLQGGDMHRDLFKINAKAKLLQRRSRTFSHPDPPRSYGSAPDSSFHNGTFSAVEQRAPGGFRRQFIQQQRGRLESVTAPVTRNFVAFLDLYGGFAGEDLYESEDDIAVESGEDEEAQAAGGERTPLLRRRRSSKARKPGDAGQMRAFFTLLKAFVGTGIMFLPKAFSNGGILFSSIAMVVVSILTCICFHLLLQCRKRYGGSYGDIGEEIGGPRMRSLILSSITISQIGFVCACIIFTAENFSSFLDAVTPTTTRPLSTAAFIGLQLLLLIPFSLIRNISKLGPAALVADICIMLGLSYIYYYDISSLATRGIHKSVVLFNPAQYTLTIGSSIFAFEGIGLILPIQSSMAEPDKFSPLLYLVMLLITLVFTSVGALSYATFGSTTMTELISNLPQSDPLVNAVQFLYAFAVLVGTPVQLFPAVRILEARLFGHRSGKSDRVTKWRKNAFRAAVVAVCGLVSVAGASDLDRFVALIGSFACVPLVYIYPALLHYKGVATTRAVVVGDVLLMALGLLAMVYTTIVTVAQWS